MYVTLNNSIQWLEDNPDEDPTTYALQNLDYYRGLYDFGAKFKMEMPVLKPGEIFINGNTGHFLVIGAKEPFWCTAVSVEEINKRIHENKYSDFPDYIYVKHSPIKELENFIVDPDKVVYFNMSKETAEKLGLDGNLALMAPRMFSEEDIAYWKYELGNAIPSIYYINYPKINIAAIADLCLIIDKITKEVPSIRSIVLRKIMWKLQESRTIKPDIKTRVLTEEAPDYALKVAEDVSKDIEETKEAFAPSITETAIALANKGIGAKRQERYKDAILYYKAVVRLLPENGGIYYNLGKLFYIIGEYRKSRKAYTLAYIFGAPNDDHNLFMHLGHALKDEGNEDDPYVKTYRDSICGKRELSMRYISTPSMDNEYIQLGLSKIDEIKSDYERRLI